MGILDDVLQKAKDAAEVVGKKTGEIVDISKLKYNAAETRGDIAKRFESLGKIVYEAKKTGNDSSSFIDESIEGIEAAYEKLAEINDKINEMKNIAKCPSCGAFNPIQFKHCSECGARLNNEDAAVDEEKDGGQEESFGTGSDDDKE